MYGDLSNNMKSTKCKIEYIDLSMTDVRFISSKEICGG